MSAIRRPSLARFWRNENGTIAPTYGLMGLAMFMIIGGAIDTSRWMQAKQVTKSAMDAAVLAGGRALQLSGDINNAIAVAQQYYQKNIVGRLPVITDTVTFVTGNAGTKITATGNAYIKTTLLGLAGIDQMPLLDLTGADYSQAKIAVGGNAGHNLEISMMLDITGSMAGSKLTDMKDAAKDLIDIVVWDDQSSYTSKVALVPFSQAVNVGSTYFNAITNENTNSTLVDASDVAPGLTFHAAANSSVSSMLNGLRRFAFVQPAHAKKKDKDDGGNSPPTYDPCAVDRTGADALTDAAPGPGKYMQAYDIAKQSVSHTQNSDCRPASITIQPLTKNKSVLTAKVDSFVAAGWTAGAVGTAYAWYMLSPNWSNVWPAASTPASYSDAATKKIAILMTDGEYNTWYNGNSNGTASQQAVSLCTGMKNAGIEVYTVGFALSGNQTATSTLASCATDASHAYVADNGAQLKQAFRDIALKSSALYLSK